MSSAIFPAARAIDSYRNSGYKHSASAVAELVDNSYEAKAKNVWIIVTEGVKKGGQREVRCIENLYVVDDGIGMDKETLALSLQFGGGTRTGMATRERGLGRFGMGLPNASVSQCKRVSVYSADSNNKYLTTYLDVDEIKGGKQEEVPAPKKADIDDLLGSFLDGSRPAVGTTVHWSKIDRFDIRRTSVFFEHLAFELGRRYRHMISEGKLKIHLISEEFKERSCIVKPVDPLFLMAPSQAPNYETKPAFEVRGDGAYKKVQFPESGKPIGYLYFKFSKAPADVRQLGGASRFGKFADENTGISILRNWREIDFGDFGVYDYDDRNRWWGAEINFDPTLDEFMGVNFLKQGVRFRAKDKPKDQFDENQTVELWALITQVLKEQIGPMIKEIKAEGRPRTKAGPGGGAAPKIATDSINQSGTPTLTEEKDKEQPRPEGDKIAAVAAALNANADDPEMKQTLKEMLAKGFQMHLTEGRWEGPIFLSVKREGNQSIVQLNQDHPFYSAFYEPVRQSADDHSITALDLLLLSFIGAQETDRLNAKFYDHVREKWGAKLREFLEALAEGESRAA
ncbi:MAG: ATP-binding protein [Elusimicrobiota bacterium]|nr:MAG: ATP-binding protein [Elusimicrobiota bacterium]